MPQIIDTGGLSQKSENAEHIIIITTKKGQLSEVWNDEGQKLLLVMLIGIILVPAVKELLDKKLEAVF